MRKLVLSVCSERSIEPALPTRFYFNLYEVKDNDTMPRLEDPTYNFIFQVITKDNKDEVLDSVFAKAASLGDKVILLGKE